MKTANTILPQNEYKNETQKIYTKINNLSYRLDEQITKSAEIYNRYVKIQKKLTESNHGNYTSY